MKKEITDVYRGKFTVCVAVFDSSCDVSEVDQFGFLDLRQSFLTGTVEGSLAPTDDNCNGIEDPGSLLNAPKDQFEAIRQAQAVAKAASKNAPAGDAPTEGGAASSAAAE